MSRKIDPLFANHPDVLAQQKHTQDFMEGLKRDLARDGAGEAWHKLLDAAKAMPRATPKPGGASTEHDFKIEAAIVWNLDRAIKAVESLALAQAQEPREDAQSSAEYHQRRGVAWDIIDEAILTYRDFMLDDDYEPYKALEKIIGRLQERRNLYHTEQLSAPPPQVDSGREEDDRRFEFLEQWARKSHTGISFDWIPSVEGEKPGFRFMRYHDIGEPKKTIREAIDEAALVLRPERSGSVA